MYKLFGIILCISVIISMFGVLPNTASATTEYQNVVLESSTVHYRYEYSYVVRKGEPEWNPYANDKLCYIQSGQYYAFTGNERIIENTYVWHEIWIAPSENGYRGTKGWVCSSSDYIGTTIKTVLRAKTTLEVYKSPGSGQFGYIYSGQKYHVVDSSGDWFKIQMCGDTAGGGARQGWVDSGGTASPPDTTSVTLDTSVIPSAGGSISLSPQPDADGKYPSGTDVTLSASAASGYEFVHWGGSATSTWSSQKCRRNPVTITMGENKVISANFEGITISVSPPQWGDTWHPDETHRIYWSVSGDSYTKNHISHFWVYYSINDGNSWTSIDSTSNYYLDWSVPSVSSSNCRIKVRAIDTDDWILDEGRSGRFTIGVTNNPPYKPDNPSPRDGKPEAPIDTDLSWSGGDPDDDSVTYDVYFEKGDSTPDQLVSNDQTGTAYNPGTLDYGSHYYWKVVAKDQYGATTTGLVWDFTTENLQTNPTLSYSPSLLDFDTVAPGYSGSKTFNVWNCGTGTLSYSLSENIPWVTRISPSSGSSTGEHNTITVYIDTSGLSDGDYTGSISITSNGGGGSVGVSVTIKTPTDLGPYALNTYVSGSGTISLNPSGGDYDKGTSVTLTAQPASGYKFDHWSGDASGTSTSVTITMNSDKSVTAYFVCDLTCWSTDPLSNTELADLVCRHFPDGTVSQTGENIRVTAYAVARAESGGNPTACGDNGQSIGIWQIHLPSHPEYSKEWLFDLDNNAEAATAISNDGTDWNAWCTWEKSACNGNGNEAYKGYLDEARAALGISPNPELCYSPSSSLLDFGTVAPGYSGSKAFTTWNCGTGTLSYSLSENISWVTRISPSSGSSTGEQDTITVYIDTTGLPDDDYSGSISITSNGGSGSVGVSVKVETSPDEPPDTFITQGPDEKTINYSDVTFSYRGLDDVTFFGLDYSCKLEGDNYNKGWSRYLPFTLTTYNNLPNGRYTFKVRAKDEAGNVDPSPAAWSFTVAVEGGATLAKYDRAAAVEYAKKYANRTDTDYCRYYIEGNDCAHFVSHCLAAGGLNNSEPQWAWAATNDKRASCDYIGSVHNLTYWFDKANIATPVEISSWDELKKNLAPGDVITANNRHHAMFYLNCSETEGYYWHAAHSHSPVKEEVKNDKFERKLAWDSADEVAEVEYWHITVPSPSIRTMLCSPGELRVYDSQGRVTGMVNGEEKNEIPYSTYYENTVTIYSPSDSYSYEVAGTDEGTYGLEIICTEEGDTSSFGLADVPTSASAVHQYAIDWDALSQGKQSVTMKIDSDGDGVFEETRYLGYEEEIPWLWIVIGVVAALVAALLVGRRIGKKQAPKASGKEET